VMNGNPKIKFLKINSRIWTRKNNKKYKIRREDWENNMKEISMKNQVFMS
jgi:hypothetical protein